jgi:N-methylhydantoinase A
MPAASSRVAIDTGGTFTDCVWVEGGELRVRKLASTPHDPGQALLDAVTQTGAAAGEVRHGTTVGTNALLERPGARVAFVTTAGFEDTIVIGRQARPHLYRWSNPPRIELAPEDLRFGIAERTLPDGSILQAPDAQALGQLVRAVAAARPEAIAVSLLFSFANPANERAVARALAPLEVPISLSHVILPEFREYERGSTVLLNAYLAPRMGHYLGGLETKLSRRQRVAAGPELPQRHGARSQGQNREIRNGGSLPGSDLWEGARSKLSEAAAGDGEGAYTEVRDRAGSGENEAQRRLSPRPTPCARLHVMQSSGGIAGAALAAREPVRTILSGPAGGVVGAWQVARQAGYDRILTFDMGGTSTDVALVDGRGPQTTRESQILGLPVSVPMLDIHTVGAGGGSLAGFDAGGALTVGPTSAGADPGPICYGRGTQPTVTDANLILGRLDPEGLLGGGFKLDVERTRKYMAEAKGRLASLEVFADGICRLAEATMEKALRVISVERGFDPREFTLVSFGGAGPLHACALAEGLEIPRVLVPRMPGALSALGILCSDLVKDYSRTVMESVKDGSGQSLAAVFAQLEALGWREMAAEGLRARSRRSLDIRYSGQGFELEVEAGSGFAERFHQLHQQRYGYADRARPLEVVNVRVRMTALASQLSFTRQRSRSGDARQALKHRRGVWQDGNRKKAGVYDRGLLRAGDRFAGPAVINEYSATTFVPPKWRCEVDGFLNLILEPAR